MVTMSVSVPERMKDYIDAQIEAGDFTDAGDYLRDLIRRDQNRQLEELRATVDEALAGGISARTFEQRIADGDRLLESELTGNG
jgi:antitoxin ParD1/3/4